MYYHWAAAHVLHEPAIAAGVSGNALGFMDLAIVWVLLFAVGGGSWPIAGGKK
jgi:AAT family amino acid transporter